MGTKQKKTFAYTEYILSTTTAQKKVLTSSVDAMVLIKFSWLNVV